MTSKIAVQDFLSQKVIAVAGASRDTKKFGYAVFHDLKAKGYTVYPVNPKAENIDGDKCYAAPTDLPEQPGGLVIVTAPTQTEQLVRQAAQAGIQRIWLQQGSETPAAIQFCQQNGITVITGECIFMYAEPTAWFHKAHRFVNALVGKSLN
jgi:uncharacterized protein